MASKELARLIPVLERVSALRIRGNDELLARLEESIKLASKLQEVNVDNVEPLYHVMENESLLIQNDVVEEQSREDVMKNAARVVEQYFVTPLSQSTKEKVAKPKEESFE